MIASRFGNSAVASLVKTVGSFQQSNFYLYCAMYHTEQIISNYKS